LKHPEIKSLYKYRAFNEFSLQMLITETAWFAKPSSFNDPFDCGILIDEERMEESIQTAITEAYARNGVREEEIPRHELEIKQEDKEAFYSYRNSVNITIQNTGIFSLSEVNNDVLMWAHYADSHKGFCIEYSRSPDNILGKTAEPVLYQEELPSLSASAVTSRNGSGINSLWLTKSSHWRYEREWRILSHKGGNSHEFPCRIASIILGLNMNRENRYTIRRIMKNRGVIFKEALREKSKFGLIISEAQT